MYLVTPNESLGPVTCSVCEHRFPKDTPCLSDIPDGTPKTFDRGPFRHFHVKCDECRPSALCYELYASGQTPFAAQTKAECVWCGDPISVGQRVFREYIFEWGRRRRAEGKEGLAGGLAASGRVDARPISYNELSSRLKLRFRRAGLGNGRGARTTPEAEQLFLRSVPRWVRSSGERAVKAFLKDKHASHIESVANAPGKAKIMGNMVWESRKRNWSRGPRNMTGVDRLRAHAKNGVHAARLGAKGFGAQLGKAAAFAALLELPVSAVENTIRVVKGSVSTKDAAKQTVKNTATAGAIGGVTAAGITGAVALGAGPAMTALSPIVAPAGAAIYVISAFRRITGATRESRPFEPMTRYFHETCYGQFASGMSTGSEDDGDGPGASPCGRPSDRPRAPSGGRLAEAVRSPALGPSTGSRAPALMGTF